MFSIRLDKQASIMHIKPTKLKDEVRRERKKKISFINIGTVLLHYEMEMMMTMATMMMTTLQTPLEHTYNALQCKLLDSQTANTGLHHT